MPIIRYPVGDNGIWVDEKGSSHRKYKILGRSEEGARIGPVTFYVEDFQHILKQFESEFSVSNSQMVIEHYEHKDCLTLRIATHERPSHIEELNTAIIKMLYRERHMFEEEIGKGKIHPIKIEWLNSEQLEINKRTGKLIQIIDKRFK